MARKRVKPVWIVFAASGVVITAAGLMHLIVLTRSGSTLALLEAEIQRTAQANVQAEQGIRDLPQLRRDVHRFAKQAPPDSDLSPLLESVGTDLADDVGGSRGTDAPQREIVTKPTVPGQPVARIPFSLQYNGSFRSTIAVLDRLQDGALLTRIERIVMEQGPSLKGGKPLRVQVDFSTFARTAKELEAWAHVDP